MNRDPYFNPPTNIDFTPENPERGLAIGVSRGGPPPSADPMDAPSGLTVNIDPYHDQLGRFTTGPGAPSRGVVARGLLYTDVTEFPSTAPAEPFGTPTKTPSPASTPTPNPNEPHPTPTSTPSATPASTPVGTPASMPTPTPAGAPSTSPANTPSSTPASTWSGTPEKSPSRKGKSSIEIVRSSFPIDTTYKNKGEANPGGVYLTHYGPKTWDHTHDSNTDKGIGNHNNKLNGLSLAISDDLAHAAGLVRGRPVYLNGRFIGNYDDRAPEDGRVDIYDHGNRAGTGWGGMLWGGSLSSKP